MERVLKYDGWTITHVSIESHGRHIGARKRHWKSVFAYAYLGLCSTPVMDAHSKRVQQPLV